jgi:ubiquinone/menaquinone biosynthesis C-methylase UbiE
MNKNNNIKDNSEFERIKHVYEKRYSADKKKYSLFTPGEHFMDVSFERDLIKALKQEKIFSLAESKIFEIGCGDGRRLRNLQRLDSVPANQYGIELLDFYVKDANILSSNCKIQQGNAIDLPYENQMFDIVYQRTVFTSVLNIDIKKKIALEMLRVLKPDGIILWYDYHMNNPRNPDVRGVKKKEIYELFPDCEISLKRITLAPPISRKLAPLSFILCMLLEKIPFLCTHYLGVIRKKVTA